MTTFEDTEVIDGKPVSLLAFTRGSEAWRYTDAKTDIVLDGITYRSALIVPGRITQTLETQKTTLSITMHDELALAQRLLAPVPGAQELPISVKAFRYHEGDTTKRTYFTGIIGTSRGFDGMVEATAESIQTLLELPIFRMRVQRNCNNVLFDHNCKLIRSDWERDAIVLGINQEPQVGPNVTMEVLAVGETLDIDWYSGGELNVGGHRYFLQSQREAVRGVLDGVFTRWTITCLLHSDMDPSVVGQTGQVIPGCDGRWQTCKVDFENTVNFTGFPFLPMEAREMRGRTPPLPAAWNPNPRPAR